MLIAFEKGDYRTETEWLTFLERLNVPEGSRPYITVIAIETERVNATQDISGEMVTIRYNPDTGVVFE